MPSNTMVVIRAENVFDELRSGLYDSTVQFVERADQEQADHREIVSLRTAPAATAAFSRSSQYFA